MPRTDFTRHYLDQIDEDHYQLELLLRAVKAVQARLYAVEASQRGVLRELDALGVCIAPRETLTYDPSPVRRHDRYRRKRRQG